MRTKTTLKILSETSEEIKQRVRETANKLVMKQETLEENCCTPVGQIKRYVDCKGCDRKPKQETLEEAAYRLSAEKFEPKHIGFMLGVIEGAKW
jgi:predicted transcriptional regulator